MSELVFPLNKAVYGTTDDSMSFETYGRLLDGQWDFTWDTEIPIRDHVGAFATVRKMHTHEGVDLYCLDGDQVYAMEAGVVVHWEHFTGALTNPPMPWWNNTQALMVEGASGVINYGEIIIWPTVADLGTEVKAGQLLGHVRTVLKKDKGRPMSMLHIELYPQGYRGAAFAWDHIDGKALDDGGVPQPKPDYLLDPTQLLIKAANLPTILRSSPTGS